MHCRVDGTDVNLSQTTAVRGATIELTFHGVPVVEDQSSAFVTYSLTDEQSWLDYRVELVNGSETQLELSRMDSLRCDGKSFQMGVDESPNVFFADEAYFGQCYGVMLNEAIVRFEKGRTLLLKSEQVEDSAVNPNASRQWSGKLVCSQGLPGVRSWAEAMRTSTRTQAYELKLQSPQGPVAHAKVELILNDRSLGIMESDEQGMVRLDLLPGSYKARVESIGRTVRDHSFSMDSNRRADTLTLPMASRVRATIRDGEGAFIAAKVQFFGTKGTPDPNFGPDAASDAVLNTVYCARGQFEQAIDPGTYQVIASHGPEYDAAFFEIEVLADQLVPIDVSLPRTVNTFGWVSAEFHSHSSPSGDNVSQQRGRVLNLLAEHLEFAPCTEHNRIDTYADDLLALNATEAMATCTGMELTGSPLPINHQNAFPLHHHEHLQDGGGPETDADPVKQIERLALWDLNSEKVVQTNHPNIPQILGDKDLDGQPDEGFRGMLGWMDVIEVHPPELIFSTPAADVTPQNKSANRIFYWLQLLNLGYRIPGVVNTDAHYNFHGSGWLRNYLQSSADEPAEISLDEMIHACEHGHLSMTTGPFLEAEVRVGQDDARSSYIIGEDVRLHGEPSAVWIRVQRPNWFDVNRVQVFGNGRPIASLNFTAKTHPHLFQDGNIRFEIEAELPQFNSDTHLIVATIGEGLTLGPVMGEERGQLPPVAVTNPFFIDVDGGGFQANGDDLGVPFMLPAIEK
jgi:hypothetical protein